MKKWKTYNGAKEGIWFFHSSYLTCSLHNAGLSVHSASTAISTRKKIASISTAWGIMNRVSGLFVDIDAWLYLDTITCAQLHIVLHFRQVTELSLLSLLYMILSDRNDKSDRTVTLKEIRLLSQFIIECPSSFSFYNEHYHLHQPYSKNERNWFGAFGMVNKKPKLGRF